MIPHRLVRTETDKPAKQEVELHALHQLALGAHRIKRLQEHGAKQHLRRDRGAPDPRVKRRQIAIHGKKSIVDESTDRPKRMILPHPPLHVDVAEQRPRSLVRPAQISLPVGGSESCLSKRHERLLQQPASPQSTTRSITQYTTQSTT